MIYSFRAECWPDVVRFIGVANGAITIAFQDMRYPDVYVQFESHVDLGTLKACTDLNDEAHVIRETLRSCPLSANDLGREEG